MSMTYWLAQHNLPEAATDAGLNAELLSNIFQAATGSTIDESRLLKNIQKYMLDLLKDLSSYTVQYIREINDSMIKILGWSAIRVGNVSSEHRGLEHIETRITVNDVSASKVEDAFDIDITARIQGTSESKSFHTVEIPSTIDTVSKFRIVQSIPVTMVSHRFNTTYTGYDPAISDHADYAGKEYFMALTDAQKFSLLNT